MRHRLDKASHEGSRSHVTQTSCNFRLTYDISTSSGGRVFKHAPLQRLNCCGTYFGLIFISGLTDAKRKTTKTIRAYYTKPFSYLTV